MIELVLEWNLLISLINYSTLSNNEVTLLWIWNSTHSCTMCMEYFNLYIIIDKYQKFSIHIPQSEHFSS